MNTEKTAFVTGATGLLGNNLVRLLLKQGYRVKALVRSPAKAQQQFGPANDARLQLVVGDLARVDSFAASLQQCDVLFHTGAYFRDSYKGGNHATALHNINVQGTQQLLGATWQAGIRNMVHISSIAVLGDNPGGLVDESMLLTQAAAPDAYYRSKIASDECVLDFLDHHPDMHISFVLPAWMHGPGDLGPTSAGQFVQDYLQRKIPGIVDAAFSLVDARDVAQVVLAASLSGQRGERYLAAGYPVSMGQLLQAMESVTGVPAPKRKLPRAMLYIVATMQEIQARLTGKPALLSLAMVNNMAKDYGRRFSAAKIQREFNLGFRPMAQTLADEVAWFRQQADQMR